MQRLSLSAQRCDNRKSRALLAVLAAAVIAGACANSETAPLESRLGKETRYTYKGKGGGNGWGSSGLGGPVSRHALDPKTANAAFKTEVGDLVYFVSDSSDILAEAQQTLSAQAKWLQSYPDQTVTVEGHADERGTREYNIALGARRANAVKDYLSAHGVSAARIRTISYGKERPVMACDDISCWSKNRRAQTVLSSTAVSRN